MPFGDHHDMVKAFPSNRSNHALGIGVLPVTLASRSPGEVGGGPKGIQPRFSNPPHAFATESDSCGAPPGDDREGTETRAWLGTGHGTRNRREMAPGALSLHPTARARASGRATNSRSRAAAPCGRDRKSTRLNSSH